MYIYDWLLNAREPVVLVLAGVLHTFHVSKPHDCGCGFYAASVGVALCGSSVPDPRSAEVIPRLARLLIVCSCLLVFEGMATPTAAAVVGTIDERILRCSSYRYVLGDCSTRRALQSWEDWQRAGVRVDDEEGRSGHRR